MANVAMPEMDLEGSSIVVKVLYTVLMHYWAHLAYKRKSIIRHKFVCCS